jgi:hypothetical protein
LAADTVDIVLSFLSDELGILTDAQARQHRIKLMQEREAFQGENNKAVFERIAGLQEHCASRSRAASATRSGLDAA